MGTRRGGAGPTAAALRFIAATATPLSAEHVGEHVRGVIARHHGSASSSWRVVYGGRASTPRRSIRPRCGTHWRVRRCPGAGFQHHHRQQRLDGACGRMRLIRVAGGQNCAGVQIGEHPCLRRSFRQRDGAGRLDTGLRRRRAERPRGRAQVIANAANNFRTNAERNRHVLRRCLERVAIQQLCLGYRAPMVALRSSAKPQSSRPAA